MNGQREPYLRPPVTATEVVKFLQRHPDFFESHPQLLQSLKIPHRGGQGTVSLIERQVVALRRRSAQLEKKLFELVDVARVNQRTAERLQAVAMAVLETESLDDLLAALLELLQQDFELDQVAIKLFDPGDSALRVFDPQRYMDASDPALAPFVALIDSGDPRCGKLERAEHQLLFGSHQPCGSAAIVPLGEAKAVGLLALASRDSQRFRHGDGDWFLRQLASLISAGLRRQVAPSSYSSRP